MIPRLLLPVLLAVFAILIVSFSVLMGGFAIASAAADPLGARVLWWIAMGCLILFVIDALLLIAVVAVRQLDATQSKRAKADGRDDLEGSA